MRIQMAMEMGCCRSCTSVSSIVSSSSKIQKASLDFSIRRQERVSWPWRVRASVEGMGTEEDCNQEECAPTKEVGKLSMKWEVEDNSKVTGTYPPIVRERRWTGYVEKDTAGQTNIYAVEPTVYVSENVLSSGEAGGTSDKAASQNLAVTFGLGVVSVAVAAAVLLSVTNAAPSTPEVAVGYTGPPLSYYIAKFSPQPSTPRLTTAFETAAAEQTTTPDSISNVEETA